MNDTSNLTALMMMNTIGLSIVYAELKSAFWHYKRPKWRPKASSDSLAFIEGTGLELMIQTYNLMYDAEKIRNVFFSMVGDHAKISDIPMKRINEGNERNKDEEC